MVAQRHKEDSTTCLIFMKMVTIIHEKILPVFHKKLKSVTEICRPIVIQACKKQKRQFSYFINNQVLEGKPKGFFYVDTFKLNSKHVVQDK